MDDHVSTFHPIWRRSRGEGGRDEFDSSNVDFCLNVRVRDATFIQGQGRGGKGSWMDVSVVPDELPEKDVELLDMSGGGGGHNCMVPNLG